MNNDPGGELGLMIKGSTQVSYLEFTLGSAPVTEAKLVLYQDDGGVKPLVTWTAVVRGAEFSFDEKTFNTAGAGNDWPLLGTFEIVGTPVTRFYEFDVTDWYNDNLGRTMSIYLSALTNADPECGPIFDDREGTRTGNPAVYGPRIEVTPATPAPCSSLVSPSAVQTSAGIVDRDTWPRYLYWKYINTGANTNGYTVALTDSAVLHRLMTGSR